MPGEEGRMRVTEVSMREEIDGILGTVDSIMQGVIVLRPDEPLQDAVVRLERAGVSGGPVMDRDQLVGMVSLADMFRAAGIDPKIVAASGPWHRYERSVAGAHRTVGDAMSTRVVALRLGSTIGEAAAAMREHAVNRIPILDERGALIGIVAGTTSSLPWPRRRRRFEGGESREGADIVRVGRSLDAGLGARRGLGQERLRP
jgi:CBS domain-containing protein